MHKKAFQIAIYHYFRLDYFVYFFYLSRMRNLFLFFLFLPITNFAQVNHVSNGSFETYTNCPIMYGMVGDCLGWANYSTGTPDYFNVCHTGIHVGVPNNFIGTQTPAHGSAYMGLLTYYTSDYREYLTTAITPLQKGGRYEFSMSVSLAEDSDQGTFAPSVFFFDNGPSFVNTDVDIPRTPQLTFTSAGKIMDKTSWTRISELYVADSNYDNIVIGNFLPNATTPSQPFALYGSTTYYYVDSIVIKLAPRIQILQTDTLVCGGDSISVSYAIESGAPFTSSSVFSLELSNATGSFAAPTVIASIAGTSTSGSMKGFVPFNTPAGNGYRVRIRVSNPFDESVASSKNIRVKTISVTASSNSPACQHSTLSLTASSVAGATYTWAGPASFSSTLQNPSIASVQPVNAGAYTVRASSGGCTSAPQTVNVVVTPAPGIKAYVSPNDTICLGSTATFVAFPTIPNSSATFQWYLNGVPVPSAATATYTAAGLNSGDEVHCILTTSGTCAGSGAGPSTDTFNMTVLPIVTVPQVDISANPGLNVNLSTLVTFTANTLHGGTTPKYQWYKNGVLQTGAIYATWATSGLSFGDMVHVDIISEDPCAQNKNASDTVWMQFPAGIAKGGKQELALFPNPNNGSFTIAGVESATANVQIMNTLGQVVYNGTLYASNGTIRVDTQLARGIYIVRIEALEKAMTMRLNIETDK
ncbi:MAG: T9SS type A sorting domain-containing protein [Sphingobacteriales bacterium]|nr:MAG: T9SS type A sorting domain-containing protein [Sphingobacteriales bacterium]